VDSSIIEREKKGWSQHSKRRSLGDRKEAKGEGKGRKLPLPLCAARRREKGGIGVGEGGGVFRTRDSALITGREGKKKALKPPHPAAFIIYEWKEEEGATHGMGKRPRFWRRENNLVKKKEKVS